MKKLIVIVLVLVIGILYFLTLPKGIGFGDSGTLAAAAVSLGIPNPPGFPTYLLLGHLFSLLPIGSILLRLQLLSLLPALGIVILVFIIVSKNNGLTSALFSAISVSLFYGFFSQVGNVESYMLTNFFIFGLISLALNKKRPEIIGVVLGLAAGLNPIGIVALPVLMYLLKKPKDRLKTLFISGIIATLVYLYLPIRAFTHPFLNWGNPQTISSFIKYITGSGLNISSDAFINGFVGSFKWFIFAWGRFFYLAWTQLSLFIIVLSFFGGWQLWKKNRTKFWVFIMILLANVSVAGIYISGNQDIWLITSLIVLIIFAGEGLNQLGKNGWIVGLIAVAIIVWFSAPKILERSKTNISEQYLSDIYQYLPKNSILIGGGETFNALTLYAHEVIKIRPDVTPIDMTIYYGQDWYRQNIKSQKPTSLKQGESKVNISNQSPRFSDDLEFSRALESFANLNSDRPIFVTGYLLTQPIYANSLLPAYIPQTYHLQQKGLVYQLAKTDMPPIEIKKYPLAITSINYQENNYRKALNLISMEYSFALEKAGDYLLNLGKEKEAFDHYTKAMQIAPEYFDQNRLQEKVAN